MPKTDQKSDYDAVPYASASYPESHPDILAGIGRLFGLDTPNPSTCRMLEFACADGSNLLPMACELPGSEFVGIDLSKRQIEVAGQAAKEAGITNIRFHAADLLDADNLLEGEFDYIVAHGLYSWVPDDVKQKLLELTKKHLSLKGVAYISYNTLPGWQPLLALREMMIYHTSAMDDIAQKSSQSRALINFLAGTVPGDNYYGMLLKSQAKEFSEYSDAYFTHDWLESKNDPLFLHQFVAEVNREGLQYLGNVYLPIMFAADLQGETLQTLRGLSADQVQFEQYSDFVHNRRFRHSLLCHVDQRVAFDLKSARLDSIYLRSNIIACSDKANGKFISRRGKEIDAHNKTARTLLGLLADTYPDAVPFKDLADSLEEALASAAEEKQDTGTLEKEVAPNQATDLLLDAAVRGMVEVTGRQPLRSDNEFPRASAYARYQATNSFYVVNRLHETKHLDPLALLLLRYLDGRTSRDELARRITDAVKAGDISFEEEGQPVSSESLDKEELLEMVDEGIRNLQQSCFL